MLEGQMTIFIDEGNPKGMPVTTRLPPQAMTPTRCEFEPPIFCLQIRRQGFFGAPNSQLVTVPMVGFSVF